MRKSGDHFRGKVQLESYKKIITKKGQGIKKKKTKQQNYYQDEQDPIQRSVAFSDQPSQHRKPISEKDEQSQEED
jgi:hypothetical protein